MPEPAITGTYPHPGIPGAEVTAGDMSVITPWLQRYAERAGWLACDIETYGLGLDSRRIKCVVFANEHAVLVLNPRVLAQAMVIRKLIDTLPRIVFHNGVFDVLSLSANGLMDVGHVDKVWDTVIYARIAEPGETTPKTLEACTARYLGIPSRAITDVFKTLGYSKQEGFYRMDIDSPAYVYGAGADGIVTARLVAPLMKAAHDRLTAGHPFSPLQPTDPGWAGREIEKWQQKNRINLRRTVTGLRVDLEFLEQFRQMNGQTIRAGEAKLQELGIRPGVAGDLTKWLEDRGELPPSHPRTAKGAWSGQKKHLQQLGHPVAQEFLRVKELTKVQDDYLVKVVELARPDSHGDLRVHPITNICTAAHGRDSMGDPPLQQFPKPARGIILPDRGDVLASVDWAQQEPVIGLNLAGDVEALADYELRGKKIYEFVSAISGTGMKVSKVIVLAGMYGEGKAKLSADLGLDPGPYFTKNGQTIATYKAAKELQERVFGAIPRTRDYIDHLKNLSKQVGMVVTMNGRVLPIPFGEYEGRRSRQNHKAPNYTISGSASDQMTDTQIEMDRQGLAGGYYLGMHDELVVSADIAHDVQKIMEIPPQGLIRLARRTPKVRTDMEIMGERWVKPE